MQRIRDSIKDKATKKKKKKREEDNEGHNW